MSSSSLINSNANSKVTLTGVVNKTASSLPEALTFVSCLQNLAIVLQSIVNVYMFCIAVYKIL